MMVKISTFSGITIIYLPLGHDGTWVAHPGLVSLATEVFDSIMTTPNQLTKLPKVSDIDNMQLTLPPDGARTEKGFRRNVSITLGWYKRS